VNRSPQTRVLLRSVNLYQRLTAHRPSPCRYVPTCSEYAREALETHGAARGTWLTVRRLSRCHPLGGFGCDPVPTERT
jgi:putative membrane protein insertion efficiency factor